MYDAMLAESVTITGHNGDEIEAYSARALKAGPVGGVVVNHHLPGYDRQTEEFTRGFAAGGLNAVMPNLYHREAPGAAPDDAMAAARARGVNPSEPSTSADHRSVYPRSRSRANQSRWAWRGIPSNGIVIPGRDGGTPAAGLIGPRSRRPGRRAPGRCP